MHGPSSPTEIKNTRNKRWTSTKRPTSTNFCKKGGTILSAQNTLQGGVILMSLNRMMLWTGNLLKDRFSPRKASSSIQKETGTKRSLLSQTSSHRNFNSTTMTESTMPMICTWKRMPLKGKPRKNCTVKVHRRDYLKGKLFWSSLAETVSRKDISKIPILLTKKGNPWKRFIWLNCPRNDSCWVSLSTIL